VHGSENLDARGNVRQRVEDAHQLRDLLLAAVLGAGHHLPEVFARQVRRKQEQPSEVELARGHSVEHFGKFADQPRRGHAPDGLVFREAELIDAIGKQTRTRPLPVQLASIHFSQMRQQRREQLIRPSDQSSSVREQLGVRERRNHEITPPRVLTRVHAWHSTPRVFELVADS
jgi:hypothetical protein